MRLAATLGGTLMGQGLPPAAHSQLELAVDLDLGPLGQGLELSVQLLRWAPTVPVVEEVARVESGCGVLRIPVEVHPDEPWLVLRVTDPSGRVSRHTPAPYSGLGRSVAYASPWWISPPAR
jgi:hypothetical protein